MIVDTSALLAILFQEPEAERIAVALATAENRKVAAPSFIEASILLHARRGDEAVRSLDLLIARFNIEITPFNADQARIARAAFKRFSKGRHKAALNFGDCIAYALARHTGEPLLFKGADFSRTDVAVAPYLVLVAVLRTWERRSAASFLTQGNNVPFHGAEGKARRSGPFRQSPSGGRCASLPMDNWKFCTRGFCGGTNFPVLSKERGIVCRKSVAAWPRFGFELESGRRVRGRHLWRDFVLRFHAEAPRAPWLFDS